MKKKKIDLSESRINRIIKESMRKILKEGTTIDELEEQLKGIFEENLLEIYREKVENEGYYDFDIVEDYCSDYANMTAEQLARDCITVINSSNWDVPKNNLRSFGFVMESEYGITNKDQLLSRDDAAEIIISWFWECFGTNELAYNFANDLYEYMNNEEIVKESVKRMIRQSQQRWYHCDISTMNDEMESLSHVKSSDAVFGEYEGFNGFKTPNAAFNSGLKELKKYSDGSYIMEVWCYVDQENGKPLTTEYVDGYLATNVDGKISKYI